MFVIAENEKKGIVDPHAELYRLLHAYHQEEQKEHLARENIDKYLEKKIAPLCPFAHSDRFKFHGRHDGIWSAQSVKAVYGTNTGPFWILTARNVLPSGRLGHIQREFWQRDAKLMLPLKPYWKPHTWREVVERDSCLYKGNLGEIVAVNHSTKKAHITSNNETIVVRQLRDLKVPLSRMEENVI